MKINLVSDLHLEFGYQELPGGEVLILAGDIAEARSIKKHHHSTKVSWMVLTGHFPAQSFSCTSAPNMTRCSTSWVITNTIMVDLIRQKMN